LFEEILEYESKMLDVVVAVVVDLIVVDL